MTNACKTKTRPAAAAQTRYPVMLYNLAEAAERTDMSAESIVKLCTDGKAPRHYLTGDKVDIYFDARSLKELRRRVGGGAPSK